MYIPPFILQVPEFAVDFCEEQEQLFDVIYLKEGEELDDITDEINGCVLIAGCSLRNVLGLDRDGCGDGYNSGYADGDGDGDNLGNAFGYALGKGTGFGHGFGD